MECYVARTSRKQLSHVARINVSYVVELSTAITLCMFTIEIQITSLQIADIKPQQTR